MRQSWFRGPEVTLVSAMSSECADSYPIQGGRRPAEGVRRSRGETVCEAGSVRSRQHVLVWGWIQKVEVATTRSYRTARCPHSILFLGKKCHTRSFRLIPFTLPLADTCTRPRWFKSSVDAYTTLSHSIITPTDTDSERG
jgi:hypothetical protein